ncbi:unnamed protein product [Cylindrotheca closterium]|uniref:Uncharacterized protein n=1 Tax=Cylindrotheca closterium TaxID=2856 RepID=A0AAD2FQY2_9STRA|nr:unnamed protein product [Cylindrotheca closterium]
MTKQATRKTKNVFQQMAGCFKKSDHKTKIKYNEHLINKRKREFGIAYMNLVLKNASEQELRLEKEGCLKDIDKLVKEIEELETKVEQVDVETRSKIHREPSTSNPTIEQTGV